jgi:AcrR family transcriptional regulator
MITAVAESGYQATGIRDLARLAGVSPNAVYEFYANKEECFLDTHDVISDVAIKRLTKAADDSGEDWHERTRAGVRAFIDAVVENPAAASLAILETHAVGARALEHQQHALDQHASVIRRGLERAPHGAEVSDTTIRALVAGIRSVVYHCLNSRHPEQLRPLVDPIFEWMSCYVSPAGSALPPAPPLSSGPRARLPQVSARRAASKTEGLEHRDRIMRAVAAIACEQGYAGLSMPAITQLARVSNQTFYEHFRNKH